MLPLFLLSLRLRLRRLRFTLILPKWTQRRKQIVFYLNALGVISVLKPTAFITFYDISHPILIAMLADAGE